MVVTPTLSVSYDALWIFGPGWYGFCDCPPTTSFLVERVGEDLVTSSLKEAFPRALGRVGKGEARY